MSEDLSLKLYYFNITAKGECIRLALHYRGIPFEDYRFKDRDEFVAMKESGKLMFGQVPALEVTNNKDNTSTLLTQTVAILRYVAKLSKPDMKSIYPSSDAILAAKVDAIADQEADCFMGTRVSSYKGRFGFGFLDEEENKALSELATKNQKETVIPNHFALLAKQLHASKTGWIAGTDGPSIAEFHWMPVLKWYDGKVLDVNDYPKIKEWMDKFYDLPEIKDWYAKH